MCGNGESGSAYDKATGRRPCIGSIAYLPKNAIVRAGNTGEAGRWNRSARSNPPNPSIGALPTSGTITVSGRRSARCLLHHDQYAAVGFAH